MTRFQKIALFVLINALGFLSPSFCYYIGITTGAIAPSSPDFDISTFRLWFFPGITMTWAVCALFSLAFFFIRDNGRWLFLLAPLVIPVLYGLSVL
ncbi:MAG: hypothetical protein ACT4OY_07775 [Alphaproteobacteria bacterium]